MLVVLYTNVLLNHCQCSTNVTIMTGILPGHLAYEFSRVQTKVDHSYTSRFDTMRVAALLTLVKVTWLS